MSFSCIANKIFFNGTLSKKPKVELTKTKQQCLEHGEGRRNVAQMKTKLLIIIGRWGKLNVGFLGFQTSGTSDK